MRGLGFRDPAAGNPYGSDRISIGGPMSDRAERPREESGQTQVSGDPGPGSAQEPRIPVLRTVTLDGQLQYIEVSACESLAVGRSSRCDLAIPDPSLSRFHAYFSLRADGAVEIQDSGSTNGTFLNGRRISQAVLSHGDCLALGNVVIRIEYLTESEVRSLNRIHDQIESAGRDPLTGLRSRNRLEDLLSKARGRDGSALDGLHSAALLDIDGFKGINDAFGHRIGDRVLEIVGQTVLRLVRDGDLAVRYGGDEILLLFHGACLDDAILIAERLRLAVCAYPWGEVAEGLQVTVSAGVAERALGEPLDGFLTRADRQLYAAKAAGRNRSAGAAVNGRARGPASCGPA